MRAPPAVRTAARIRMLATDCRHKPEQHTYGAGKAGRRGSAAAPSPCHCRGDSYNTPRPPVLRAPPPDRLSISASPCESTPPLANPSPARPASGIKPRQHTPFLQLSRHLGELAASQPSASAPTCRARALSYSRLARRPELNERSTSANVNNRTVEALRSISPIHHASSCAHDAAPIGRSIPSSVRTSVFVRAVLGPITVTISQGRLSMSTRCQDGPNPTSSLQTRAR